MRRLIVFLALITTIQACVVSAPDANNQIPQNFIEPAILEIQGSSGVVDYLIKGCGNIASKSTWTSIDSKQFKAVTMQETPGDGICTP